jgi:hypothetical protein
MGISASQNKKYTYIAENLPHFGGILCIFGEFYGIFRRKFVGDFLIKIWSF